MSSRSEAEWPDWRGETALIVGTGPSAGMLPLGIAYGKARCIAIKSAWQFVPWAEALYGCDRGWWIANRGVPEFMGLKFTPSPGAARVFRLRQTKVKPGARIVLDPPSTLGCGLLRGGGHSGWQAINLAVQFGARRIVLAGFEMTLQYGHRFNGGSAGVAKADAGRVERWRKEMDDAVEEFTKIGCDVINATPGSALRNYPRASLQELFG